MFPDQSALQMVLMIILIVGGVIGSAVTVWWFFPGIKRHISGDTYVFVFVFDGVVITAQCTATFSDILCSPEFRYY